MILKTLYLQDFGVFAGKFDENAISLEPRVKYGQKRPIVLFGGLNGAGKTTTLTAVRLALYGRQSLGRAVSTQAYHQYLTECIHRPKDQLLQPIAAGVKLDFNYGRQGKVVDYTVKRSWSVRGQSLYEYVEIFENGEYISGLSEQQKQSFLNELIPIGVADLFFFDGEKIAELAEDDNNVALTDAINRLLGLDIINRLKADLGVYLRDQKREKLPAEILEEIQQQEADYDHHYQCYQEQLAHIDNVRIESVELETAKARLSQHIDELGGAWANTREATEAEERALRKERDELQKKIRDLLGDAAALGLAKTQFEILLKQLEQEQQCKRQSVIDDELEAQLTLIKQALLNSLGNEHSDAIEQSIEANRSQKSADNTKIVHDISDTEFNRVHSLLTAKVPEQQRQVRESSKRLEEVEEALATVGLNLSRAPDEKRIANVVTELGKVENKLGQYEVEVAQHKELARKHLRNAMDCLRKLRELEKDYSRNTNLNEATTLADNTRHLLEDFAEQTKAKRVALLEQEFIKSFGKLARKDDLLITAKINPENFAVTLIDHAGHAIDKKKLSAGEKQIYAIAMLEALGRTSGRNLPIIIDTPLGRLDSRHRKNLVKNYFPTASHQVLILSTDTEVDEDFYKELSPEISHAYEVVYDPQSGCSSYQEGYFWR